MSFKGTCVEVTSLTLGADFHIGACGRWWTKLVSYGFMSTSGSFGWPGLYAEMTTIGPWRMDLTFNEVLTGHIYLFYHCYAILCFPFHGDNDSLNQPLTRMFYSINCMPVDDALANNEWLGPLSCWKSAYNISPHLLNVYKHFCGPTLGHTLLWYEIDRFRNLKSIYRDPSSNYWYLWIKHFSASICAVNLWRRDRSGGQIGRGSVF